MEVRKAIKSRKSARRFATKKPDWRDIMDCIDAARFAPMAGNNCTLKIILVQDPDKIAKITEACQQPFVGQAQYLVVFCTNPKRTIDAYEGHGEKFLRQQAGAAIQNFLLAIEDKGLATCWIGYFVEEMIKRTLKVPKNCWVEAVFPVGFESGVRGQKAKNKKKIDR